MTKGLGEQTGWHRNGESGVSAVEVRKTLMDPYGGRVDDAANCGRGSVGLS